MIGCTNGSHRDGQKAYDGLASSGVIQKSEGHIDSNKNVAICDSIGYTGAMSYSDVEKCQDGRENGSSSNETKMHVT